VTAGLTAFSQQVL